MLSAGPCVLVINIDVYHAGLNGLISHLWYAGFIHKASALWGDPQQTANRIHIIYIQSGEIEAA